MILDTVSADQMRAAQLISGATMAIWIGMGVLPLQFCDGQDAASLGLTGREIFDIAINDSLKPGELVNVVATDPKTAKTISFTLQCRIDTPVEVEYFRNGGILQTVVRRIAGEGR